MQPLLQKYCFDCHGNGQSKADVSFEKLTDAQANDPILWLKVLKNVRAGIMPPAGEPRISADDQKKMESWITTTGFGSDPSHLDPGRVTLRRLNRNEYRNSIRDLLGIDFDTNLALPPDDVGYGDRKSVV